MLTDAQKKGRQGKVMASDVAAYLGMNPYTSPLEAWALNLGYSELAENPAMQAGNFLEAGLIDWAQDRFYAPNPSVARTTLIGGTLFRLDEGWAGATPDGAVYVRELRDGKGYGAYIQIKCHALSQAQHYGPEQEDFRLARGNDLIPEWYLLQCQWEMFVTRHDQMYFGAYFGGADFRIYLIERDQELLDQIVPVLHEFWKKHLDVAGPQERPPMDGSEGASMFLRNRFPHAKKGTKIQPTPDLQAWVQQYKAARNEEEQAAEKAETLKHQIIEVMQDAEEVAGLCQYKNVNRQDRVSWDKVWAVVKPMLLGAGVKRDVIDDLLQRNTTRAPVTRTFRVL